MLGLLGEADPSFRVYLVLNFLFFLLNGIILDIASPLTKHGLFWIMEKDKWEKNAPVFYITSQIMDFFLIIL